MGEYEKPNFHWVDPGILPRGPVGDVETRIRKQLEQEGPLPTTINYGVTPTMAVADGLTAGNSLTRNRAWVWSEAAIASGQWRQFQAVPGTLGLLIDLVLLSINGSVVAGNGDIIQFGIYAPGSAAAPGVPVAGAVPWIDTPDGSLAPVWTLSGAGAIGQVFQTVNIPNLGLPAQIPLRIYLPPLASFAIRHAAAGVGTFTSTVYGRTF